MPKKAADNLAPVLPCLVIDWNRFKQRLKQARKTIETAIKTIGNGGKGKRIWGVHRNEAYGYLQCIVFALDVKLSAGRFLRNSDYWGKVCKGTLAERPRKSWNLEYPQKILKSRVSKMAFPTFWGKILYRFWTL